MWKSMIIIWPSLTSYFHDWNEIIRIGTIWLTIHLCSSNNMTSELKLKKKIEKISICQIFFWWDFHIFIFSFSYSKNDRGTKFPIDKMLKFQIFSFALAKLNKLVCPSVRPFYRCISTLTLFCKFIYDFLTDSRFVSILHSKKLCFEKSETLTFCV